MELNVDNCTRCRKVYQKNFTGICFDCVKEILSELDRTTRFLKRYPNSTIEELSDGTEVSIKRIVRFIHENKLYIQDYPNINYPCAFCQSSIRKQYMCNSCRLSFKEEVTKLMLREDTYMKDEEYKVKKDKITNEKSSSIGKDKYVHNNLKSKKNRY